MIAFYIIGGLFVFACVVVVVLNALVIWGQFKEVVTHFHEDEAVARLHERLDQ